MSRLVVSSLIVASCLSGVPALAQAPGSVSITRAPRPTLQAFLERLVWTPQERGPLLVVSPERVHTATGSSSPELSSLRTVGGVNVVNLATVLERKLARTGSLSALVPERLSTLNGAPGKPNLSQLSSRDALVALAASLSERQWQLLGGSRGLGASDLSTSQQKALFALVLPSGLQTGNFGARNARPVPPDSLAQSRLHLSRPVSFWYAHLDEKLNQSAGGIFGGSVNPTNAPPSLSRSFGAQPERPPYGVPLSEERPNRLKPSQLDYKASALNKALSLEGVETVGDLLARASQATGLELRADKRLAELPLWQRSASGQTVRCGDALELLALSVTGAFRLLEAPGQGRLWLLTDDIEGLAVRAERLRLWNNSTDEQVAKLRVGYRERLKATQPMRFIAQDNRFGFSDDLQKKLQETRPGTSVVAPLTALPMGVSQQLQTILDEASKAQQEGRSNIRVNGVENPLLDTSRIKLSLREISLTVEVPDYGLYLDEGAGFALSNELQNITPQERASVKEPEPTRPPLATRIVVLWPRSPEEARQAVTAAVAAKLSALWIATEGTKLDSLQAALGEGKKVGLPVGAVVTLAKLPESAPADLNLLGESGPYRLPDAPEALRELLPRLRALARLPNLAGLAFAESAAPGYLTETLPQFSIEAAGEYGYTPERRIRFVRTQSYDPIDLSRNEQSGFLIRPNGGSRTSFSTTPQRPVVPPHPLELWNKTRFDANKALLIPLYGALKDAAPMLPLWIEGRVVGVSDIQNTWFGSWEKADAFPTYSFGSSRFDPETRQMIRAHSDAQQARSYSQTILYANVYPDRHPETRLSPTGAPPESWLTWLLHGETLRTKSFPWDGAVLDLSTLPLEKALATLQALKL